MFHAITPALFTMLPFPLLFFVFIRPHIAFMT